MSAVAVRTSYSTVFSHHPKDDKIEGGLLALATSSRNWNHEKGLWRSLMTAREALLRTVEELPEEFLMELAEYAEKLRFKAAHSRVPTAMASQELLAQDWLRPEEDEAWRDL